MSRYQKQTQRTKSPGGRRAAERRGLTEDEIE